MKKPWVIWLSMPAFAFLWGDTARRILSAKKTSFPTRSRMDIWVEALINLFMIFICYITFPMLVLIFLIDMTMKHSYILGTIVNCIALICFYFLGVYSTYKHFLWRKNKIPYLLDISK